VPQSRAESGNALRSLGVIAAQRGRRIGWQFGLNDRNHADDLIEALVKTLDRLAKSRCGCGPT